ncbi:MAG: hypothetical protein SF187_29290 [Deltaproteobacteria bacterium]|nr:hypothetical protein [Deltaproteobacteria bacterium]
MALRKIRLVVGAAPIGVAYTWSYPNFDGKTYVIPTYELKVLGHDQFHRPVSKTFEVIRFGVHRKSGNPKPYTVGLSQHHTYVIHRWIPTYKVHSFPSREDGAWQVHGNFLIHDGPDDPLTQLYATAGCIEVCGGPSGFVMFNKFLVEISGSVKSSFALSLKEIGDSGCMSITYTPASPPQVQVR